MEEKINYIDMSKEHFNYFVDKTFQNFIINIIDSCNNGIFDDEYLIKYIEKNAKQNIISEYIVNKNIRYDFLKIIGSMPWLVAMLYGRKLKSNNDSININIKNSLRQIITDEILNEMSDEYCTNEAKKYFNSLDIESYFYKVFDF